MKRTNSFVLFGRAFKNAKKDFWVSIQVLLVVTIVVAIIFYFVEHTAQPEEYDNPWDAFVWAVTRYIGDPGKFAGKGPITLTGRYLDTFIGIMKILIFAVPAGLVANGFRQAMADEKRRLKLEDFRARITKSFRRQQDKTTHSRFVPRRVSVITLQAKKGLDTKDIIDVAAKFPEFRLRNVADTQPASDHPVDRLVVEMVPFASPAVDGALVECTSYGIKINRNSNVTIIAPSSVGEHAIGHFAYYLALYGGFNYVSKEIEPDVDEPASFYTVNNQESAPFQEFVADIKSMSAGEDKWNVVIVSSDSVHPTQFHFVRKTKDGSGLPPVTTIRKHVFDALYEELGKTLQEKYHLGSDLDDIYKPVAKKNIGVISGGGTHNNVFTMRVAYSVTAWDDKIGPIIVDVAKLFKQHLEAPERQAFDEKNPVWKKQGYGFGLEEK